MSSARMPPQRSKKPRDAAWRFRDRKVRGAAGAGPTPQGKPVKNARLPHGRRISEENEALKNLFKERPPTLNLKKKHQQPASEVPCLGSSSRRPPLGISGTRQRLQQRTGFRATLRDSPGPKARPSHFPLVSGKGHKDSSYCKAF